MATPLQYAELSQAAYDGPDNIRKIEGWTAITNSGKVPPHEGSVNGYYGVAYKNDATGEIVIANRGSRPSIVGLKEDWLDTDVDIALQSPNRIPPAFDEAEKFALQIARENPGQTINFTGHSLGGAEAQVQAARLSALKIPGGMAFTFAAPGAAFAVDEARAEAVKGKIVNYALPTDPVTQRGAMVGQQMVITQTGLIVVKNFAVSALAMAAQVALGGPLGLLAGILLGKIGALAVTHPMSNYVAALTGMVSASMAAGGGGKLQARITDMHTCPMVTGIVPHVGGPITTGCPTVLVGSIAAARLGDMSTCVGPPDIIAMCSSTVIIGGMPAARLGDMTAHGGVITTGMPTVLTGG